MQKQTMALTLCATLVLAACDGTPKQTTSATTASSVAPASSTIIAASMPAVENNPVVGLSSKDGKILIQTSGEFVDKSNDAAFLPVGVTQADVLLLQYDASRNLTISAIESGLVKSSANDLFANLKTAIENDKTLSHVSVEQPESNRLRYAYSQTGELVANESCIVSVGKDRKIVNVCASSTDLSTDELKTLLADIKIEA